MPDLQQTSSWKNVKNWLDQLDVWTVASKSDEPNPNSVLTPDIQTWFQQGVTALNECLAPEYVHAFKDALQARTTDIDSVLEELTVQDLAWQPNQNSTECISGPMIWRMAIATMACRCDWDFGDIRQRETFLMAFLAQWNPEASLAQAQWHRNLCESQPWALSTTFAWLIERKAPTCLHWVLEKEHSPTPGAMGKLVAFLAATHPGPHATNWAQFQALRPELADYIKNFAMMHQELMGKPASSIHGGALAQSWRQRQDEAPSIAPELFEAPGGM